MKPLPFKLVTKGAKPGRTFETTIGHVQGDQYFFENAASDATNTSGIYHEGGIWCEEGTRKVRDYDGVYALPGRVLYALQLADFDISEIADAHDMSHVDVVKKLQEAA